MLFGGRTLRSTTAELIHVKRYKFANAHRRSARHPLDAIRHPVIPTRPMQLGHGHEVVGQVLWHFLSFQLAFPIFGVDIRVRDPTVQRVREFPGDPVHVLRTRTGKFVYPAQVRSRVGEDRRDYASDISCGNRRGLAASKRQCDATALADTRAREGEKALQEHGRPDGDDREAGPRECC